MSFKKQIVNIVMVIAVLFLIGTMTAPAAIADVDPSDPDHVDDDHHSDDGEHTEDAPPEIPGFGITGAVVTVGALAYFLKKRK